LYCDTDFDIYCDTDFDIYCDLYNTEVWYRLDFMLQCKSCMLNVGSMFGCCAWMLIYIGASLLSFCSSIYEWTGKGGGIGAAGAAMVAPLFSSNLGHALWPRLNWLSIRAVWYVRTRTCTNWWRGGEQQLLMFPWHRHV